jgi:hypothetical protein
MVFLTTRPALTMQGRSLLAEVTEQAILASFKAVWLVRLADRDVPIQQRLCSFYEDYYVVVLSRQWLRLFLFGGLDGSGMAPAYIDGIIKKLLELIVREAADACHVELPANNARLHEIGWVLHGAVSHLAIRQHVYCASQAVPPAEILALHVSMFLAGLPAAAGTTVRPARNNARRLKSSVYD